MTDRERIVYGGIDTHQDIHVAAVVDSTGALLGTQQFPTTPLGLRALQRWLASHGRLGKVGVEGTGSYGAGLARVLAGAGFTLVEVDRPNRQLRRARGKSDTVDAEAAARAALSGTACGMPKSRDGIVEAIRVTRLAARATRRQMTRLEAQVRHLALTAPEPLRIQLQPLGTVARMRRAAALRPGPDPAEVATATRTALRTLARQWEGLRADHKALTGQLTELTARANPALLELSGVGPDTAAALLIAAGDNPERLRSSASFAALCGASPVEASSGKTQSRRLNRGGDRQANAALYRIVIVRMSHGDPATMDYLARRTAAGHSQRDAIRCLKRYAAREVFQRLQHPEPTADQTALRPRRQALALPMRAAAEHLHRPINAVARLELGRVHDPDLARRYQDWLTLQEAG
jgi:transposase